MRMRKKKHGAERIEACSELLLGYDRETSIVDTEVFENPHVHLEIGCGKGSFVCGMAEKHPDVTFIAVERVSDVMVLALEKADAAGLKNIRFVIANAADLCECLPEHSVEVLYLNFSDPWPKKGYAKRRLTHRGFLEKYKRILKEDGAIFFKTDNRGLFDFSLEEFAECGFRLENVTYDLHNSEFAADNVVTEYERNFSEKGFTINRCEAYLK